MAAKIKKQTKSLSRFYHQLRLALVPHSANQYAPYLVRGGGLIVVLTVVVLMQFGYSAVHPGSVLGRSTDFSAAGLLAATNKERTKSGLTTLIESDKLTKAANLKAEDMFANQYWAHESPGGVKPWEWFDRVGYSYAAAGENLAKNFANSDATLTAWMGSPEHRKNVLDTRFKEVGFAVVTNKLAGRETTIIVALYGAPAPSEAVAGVASSASVAESSSVALSPITRLGIAMRSITPAGLASLTLLVICLLAALAAHRFRYLLPRPVKNLWRLHHGLVKAAGISILIVATVWLYSGGQV